METLKKIWKEAYIFGIVIICILGLYVYRSIVSADINVISSDKAISMIEKGDDFVLVTTAHSSTAALTYQETIKTFLKKNRSSKVYLVDLEATQDADTFVSEYLGEFSADLETPHTYTIVDGKIVKNQSGALGYYTFDKTMAEFNAEK